VVAILLALAGSVAYGCADFAGGLAARSTHVLRVVLLAAPAGLLVSLAAWPLLGGEPGSAALAWGAASGVASAATFVLLYRSLAMGPMSVLSPVTAVTSAVLPVLVGLALGERLPPLAVVGVVLALGAVVLVSVAPGSTVSRPTRAALLVALAAGVAIALQLVTLAAAPDDSGVVVLVVARAVACAVLVAAVVGSPAARAAGRPPLALAVGSGALDALANLAFLLAARQGQLGVAAVVTALYPAGTVLLARFVLGERLHRVQVGGLVAAGAAVALLAVA